MSSGYLFLTVATGIMGFINFILTCIAVDDEENYAGFLVAIEIVLVITFLISGFLGFQS